MADIKWQRGSFLKFYSKMKIQIGAQKGLSIQSGDEFEFDGSILKYGGMEINTVELRGAIKSDWASLSEDETYIPESTTPSRNIAKAQTINTDLSKVQRSSFKALEASSLDEDTVMTVEDRRPKQGSSKVLGVSIDNSSPRALTKESVRSMPVTKGYDDQEGVSIGRIRTPTRLSSDVTKDVGLADKLTNLSGSGLIRDNIIHKEGVSIRTNVGKVDSKINSYEDTDGGVEVAKVRHSRAASTEGIEVKDTSSRPSPIISKKVKIDTKLSPRVRIARVIDPSFPIDWSFEGKLSERLARAKEHGISDDFLQALYAAEGDQMRKKLETEFPKVFR
jgi:hypothetical protein